MSQTLTISNYAKTNVLEEAMLTADATSGQPTIAVENNQNFSENVHFVIGRHGFEEVEKLTVLSASGVTGITATTNLARNHDKFEPVTRLFGNQFRVYRASNVDGTAPSDGDFTLLATVDIDYDQIQTSYTDSNGSSDYWYKATYYNSLATTETPLSESTAFRGGGYGNYATLDSIRTQAGLQNNKFIADSKIEEKRQAAQRLIDSELQALYVVPFTNPINALIAECTRLLAAGYLLTSEFGTTTRTFEQGKGMIESVTNDKKTGILDRINKKELVLTDVLGQPEPITNAGGFSGWPNSTTADADPEDGGGDFMFRVSDRY